MNIQQHFAIFDMDGTLVNSMQYWDNACAEFLLEQNINCDGIFEIMKPMTLRQSAEYLRKEFDLTFSFEDMYRRLCELMYVHYLKDIQLKPGVRAFLQNLQARNIRMCLASSTPIHLVKTCLDTMKIRDFFDFIVSAEEVGRGKTEPDIYLECVRRFGASVDDTIVFEDALIAVQTAKKAGFSVVAVYDETGEAEWETSKKSADDFITDWEKA